MSVDTSKILPIGAAVTVAAVVANVLTRFILLAFIDIDPGFQPFSIGAIAFFTALGVGASVGVFWVLTKVSDNPLRLYTIVGWVALVLSIIPNIISAVNPDAIDFPFPGATTAAFLALIVFHVVAGLISIYGLTSFTRAEA